MASQTRAGRLTQPIVRLADEQAREEAERRRRVGRGARQRDDRRDQHPAPAPQQVEADEGVDIAAEEEEEEERVGAGGEDAEIEEEEENDEGYDSFIEERSRPDTPEPNPNVVRDADGWKLIAKLGPTASFLSSFPALQEVPDQHVQAWVESVAKVLRRWREATTEEEITLALSWFLFLPQALLRKPARGGRAGRKEVARRFNYLSRGD